MKQNLILFSISLLLLSKNFPSPHSTHEIKKVHLPSHDKKDTTHKYENNELEEEETDDELEEDNEETDDELEEDNEEIDNELEEEETNEEESYNNEIDQE